MLKRSPEKTDASKINLFNANLRNGALQIFRNISAANRKNLDDVIIVFRRKCVKPESQSRAKHIWHKPTFDPNTMSLHDLWEKLIERAERKFLDNAQHMIDNLLYSNSPLRLKLSLNLVHLEKGTCNQIVANLKRELELSGLEKDGEQSILTTTAVPQNDNP